MSIYQSQIQPDYSVHYYSQKEFGIGGAGYYLFETHDVDSAYSIDELWERGASDETLEELKSIGNFYVFNEPMPLTYNGKYP